jgi:hypothetical protein
MMVGEAKPVTSSASVSTDGKAGDADEGGTHLTFRIPVNPHKSESLSGLENTITVIVGMVKVSPISVQSPV